MLLLRMCFFETFDSLNALPYERITRNQAIFKLGIDKNYKIYTKEEVEKYGRVEIGKSYEFNHYHLYLQSGFVDKTGKSVDAIIATYRDAKNVMLRGLLEIHLDTLELVRDLIMQGALLNGDSYLTKLNAFIELKRSFDTVSIVERDNWAWVNSYDNSFARFRNELIGTLCVELSEGLDLNDACLNWNKRVDPANYMKAKAPITETMRKNAEKFVMENGYEDSFNRRQALSTDINVEEIAHVNAGDGKVKTVSVFDKIKVAPSTRHKRSEFEGVNEVTIEHFMQNILPSCSSVEVFVESRFKKNFVSLFTAENKDSKRIFKWDNNFSWTYEGNLAGKSQIAEKVKSAGGNIDGVLRFSIMWANRDGDNSDLDAHCHEPYGGHIYFGNKQGKCFGGALDVDVTQPQSQMPNGAVENIVYGDVTKMPNGLYKFFVKQYADRSSKGFSAEIAVNGEVYSYYYNRPVYGEVHVATVTLKEGVFSIEHHLTPTVLENKTWGVESGSFHKVSLVCLSPNYWGNNNIGNKHYFFMLDGCKPDTTLRTFHNEYLNGELLKFRKEMEVLGSVCTAEGKQNGMAGLGFNATVRDSVILKLKGTHNRVVKVNF